MSVTKKMVAGHTYLYFQKYRAGKQIAESLGPVNDPRAWTEAWDRLKAYHFDKLEEFYSRMPQSVRDKLPLYDDLRKLVEERFRLLEAVKPQLEPPREEIPAPLLVRSRALRAPKRKTSRRKSSRK